MTEVLDNRMIIRLEAVDRPSQPALVSSDPDNCLHPDEALQNNRNYIPPRERLKMRRQRRRDSRDAYLLRKERHHASTTHNFNYYQEPLPKHSGFSQGDLYGNKGDELLSLGNSQCFKLDKDTQICVNHPSKEKDLEKVDNIDLPTLEDLENQSITKKEITSEELLSPDIFPLNQFLTHSAPPSQDSCFEGDDDSPIEPSEPSIEPSFTRMPSIEPSFTRTPSMEPSFTRISTLDDSERRRSLPGEIMDETEDVDLALQRRSSTSDLVGLRPNKMESLKELHKTADMRDPTRPRKNRKSRPRSEPFPFKAPECENCIIC